MCVYYKFPPLIFSAGILSNSYNRMERKFEIAASTLCFLTSSRECEGTLGSYSVSWFLPVGGGGNTGMLQYQY